MHLCVSLMCFILRRCRCGYKRSIHDVAFAKNKALGFQVRIDFIKQFIAELVAL